VVSEFTTISLRPETKKKLDDFANRYLVKIAAKFKKSPRKVSHDDVVNFLLQYVEKLEKKASNSGNSIVLSGEVKEELDIFRDFYMDGADYNDVVKFLLKNVKR